MTRTTSLARRRFELMAAEYVARIGERIRTRREQLGLTQEEVARRLPGKVTGQRVSLWERGEHQPRADSLEALAKALDVSVSYFLAAEPDKTETPDLVATMDSRRSSEDRIAQIEEALRESNAKLDKILAYLELNVERPSTLPDQMAQLVRETAARVGLPAPTKPAEAP